MLAMAELSNVKLSDVIATQIDNAVKEKEMNKIKVGFSYTNQ